VKWLEQISLKMTEVDQEELGKLFVVLVVYDECVCRIVEFRSP
jgi:hypothetical protein